MRYQEMDFWVKLWKKSEEYGFLAQAPAHILQQKLKDLDKAYQDGFDKSQPGKRLPLFRKRNRHDSFRFPEPKQFEIKGNRIKLPKIGWVSFFKSLEVQGIIKNATISKSGNHWFVSIQVEQPQPVSRSNVTTAIGIDMGIAKFAACSDGSSIEPIHVFRHHQKKLTQAQRILSRKTKFSNNWRKQLKRIQKIHHTIANTRLDFLHKWSTHLSKNHAIVVVEALKVKNMSQSAKGTLEEPGQKVKAKSGLNKSILDQGWGEFKRQLRYKLAWQNGIYLEVPPHGTSISCSHCGLAHKDNRLSQSEFSCVSCGYKDNADVNAAKNILAAGHAVMACGASA